MTVLDAKIAHEASSNSSAEGNRKVPVTAAVGAPVLYLETFNPSLAMTYQASAQDQSEYTARGTQVCALQIRQVRFRWFERDIDESILGRSRWKSHAAHYWRDDPRFNIEIELSDVGAQGLGEGWEKKQVGKIVLFLPSLGE